MKSLRLGLQIYEDVDRIFLIADWSNRAVDITVEWSVHGAATLSFFVPIQNNNRRFLFYNQAPYKHVVLSDADDDIWAGRVEDREILENGIRLTCFGYWSALDDLVYSAAWSQTGSNGAAIGQRADDSDFRPELFEVNLGKGEIFITPRAGEAFSDGTNSYLVPIGIRIPHNSSRNWTAIQFDVDINTSSPFEFRSDRRDDDFTLLANIYTRAAVSTATYSVCGTITGCAMVSFSLLFNSTSTTALTGSTGDQFVRVYNIRLATRITNFVNTTTDAISSGSDVTVTPASMVNIYVGQLLTFNSTAGTSETVTVKTVTSTTFTADFANNHGAGESIRSPVIFADEVVRDLIDDVDNLNTGQIVDSEALVQSPAVDLYNLSFVEASPTAIINSLSGIDATETRYEAGVDNDRLLYYRPRGDEAREWYTDAQTLEVNSTALTMRNQYYAVYRDDSGRALRTATADDAASQSRYGLTRQGFVGTATSNSTKATDARDAGLDANKDITPVATVQTRGLFTKSGARVPYWLPRPGDTLTIRNLPPNASDDIDKIRTFTIHRVRYDSINDVVSLIPELDIPSLEIMISNAYIKAPPTPFIPSAVVTDGADVFAPPGSVSGGNGVDLFG